MFVSCNHEIERSRRLIGNESNIPKRSIENCRSRESQRSWPYLNKLFAQAGITNSKPVFTLMWGAALLALGLSLILGKPALFLCCLIEPFVLIQALKSRARKRSKAFESDYTAFLLSLASAVKTGMDPLAALEQSDRLFPQNSEIYAEIRKIKEQLGKGVSEEQALAQFASSIGHPDIKLFTTAFILARREGSSLSECLQRLVRVTRQRQSFRRKLRSAVAMQKLSSFGIAAIAVLVAAIQALMNRQTLQSTLSHPLGSKAVCCGLGLIFFGVCWMVQMTSEKS